MSKSKTTMLTTTELQKLVEQAQNGQPSALEELCRHFQPLIKKEAQREAIYQSLGEDALNTAWEYFLQLIQTYEGSDYQHLPGYLRLKLHYHLFHLMLRQGQRWDHENHVEALEALGPTEDSTLISLNKMELESSLKRLQPQQKQLVQLLYSKHTQKQMAQQLHCSQRTVQRQIQALRQYFRQQRA